MKEFMLLIRSQDDHFSALSPQEKQQHLGKVMVYIEDLMNTGRLRSAQPLDHESAIVVGAKGKVKDGPFNEFKEVIVGYFLILAKDMQEAVEIARRNPNFDLDTPTTIEVRPIMVMDGINQ